MTVYHEMPIDAVGTWAHPSLDDRLARERRKRGVHELVNPAHLIGRSDAVVSVRVEWSRVPVGAELDTLALETREAIVALKNPAFSSADPIKALAQQTAEFNKLGLTTLSDLAMGTTTNGAGDWSLYKKAAASGSLRAGSEPIPSILLTTPSRSTETSIDSGCFMPALPPVRAPVFPGQRSKRARPQHPLRRFETDGLLTVRSRHAAPPAAASTEQQTESIIGV